MPATGLPDLTEIELPLRLGADRVGRVPPGVGALAVGLIEARTESLEIGLAGNPGGCGVDLVLVLESPRRPTIFGSALLLGCTAETLSGPAAFFSVVVEIPVTGSRTAAPHSPQAEQSD